MYTTAKGYIDDDGNYIYVCGACKGMWKADCAYCAGRDMDKVRELFTAARGQQYYSLLKTILSDCGKAIVDEAKDIKSETGKFTPADLIYLCIKFRFPQNRVKPLAEWLEENQFVQSGMYEHLKERGFKPVKAWSEVAASHPRLQE